MSSLSASALRATESRAGPSYVRWDAQSFHHATDRATDSRDHFPSGGSTACHCSASVSEKCLASPARSLARPRIGPGSAVLRGRSVLSTNSPDGVCMRTPSLPASTVRTDASPYPGRGSNSISRSICPESHSTTRRISCSGSTMWCSSLADATGIRSVISTEPVAVWNRVCSTFVSWT